jgi:hypothetical protein
MLKPGSVGFRTQMLQTSDRFGITTEEKVKMIFLSEDTETKRAIELLVDLAFSRLRIGVTEPIKQKVDCAE